MSFTQKILVLKRVESDLPSKRVPGGIFRIEIESGVAVLHLSIVNLCFLNGFSYHALVLDSAGEHHFDLGQKPTSTQRVFNTPPSIKKGFCAGIYAVKDDLPSTILFGATDGFNVSLCDFRKRIAERCLQDKKRSIESISALPVSPVQYDDEAVATENYYDFADQIMSETKNKKEQRYGSFSTENELPYNPSQKEKEEKRAHSYRDENAECDFIGKALQGKTFFHSVRAELNAIFNKFPPEPDLMRCFYGSKWAKISYGENKYYVVGLVFEEGAEKYVCYGVPANYSKTPPKALKGFCSFIPASIFDVTGKGYWMMFQDAKTGACVKM